jgi:GxxExxY protein
MGCGFVEAVYMECLKIEFTRRSIPFAVTPALPIQYDGIWLPLHFRPDFICYDAVIVEVKALSTMSGRDEAQLLNYQRASGKDRGLLLNFGGEAFQFKRRVWGLTVDPARAKADDAEPPRE